MEIIPSHLPRCYSLWREEGEGESYFSYAAIYPNAKVSGGGVMRSEPTYEDGKSDWILDGLYDRAKNVGVTDVWCETNTEI